MTSQTHRSTWANVPIGATVRVRSSVHWVSARTDQGEVTLVDVKTKQPRTGTPSPGQEVVVLHPGDPLFVPSPEIAAAQAQAAVLPAGKQAALAAALVEVRLGGTLLSVQDLSSAGRPHSCPPFDEQRATIRAAHLVAFHRLGNEDPAVFEADLDPAVLVALHASRPTVVPHDHDYTTP